MYEVLNEAINPGIGLSHLFSSIPLVLVCGLCQPGISNRFYYLPEAGMRLSSEHGAPELAACALADDNLQICKHPARLEANVYGNCVLDDNPEPAWSSSTLILERDVGQTLSVDGCKNELRPSVPISNRGPTAVQLYTRTAPANTGARVAWLSPGRLLEIRVYH